MENYKILVHLGVKTSHNIGNEYIDPLNKVAYKTYVETMNPQLKESVDAKLEPLTPIKEDELKYEQILDQAIFPESSQTLSGWTNIYGQYYQEADASK